MDFIDEVTPALLDEPRKEVVSTITQEMFNDFNIHFSCDDDESHAYLLVQFGVGGPG